MKAAPGWRGGYSRGANLDDVVAHADVDDGLPA